MKLHFMPCFCLERKGDSMYDVDALALVITTATTILGAIACDVKTGNMSVGTAYKTALKKVVKKAVNILHNDNSASEEVQEITFPVYIGIDEFGYTHADVIEQEFQAVLKNFAASYFKNYKNCETHTEYCFSANDLTLNVTDEWDKISHLRDIAEQAVHQHIQQLQPAFGTIPDNLVALNLIGNDLLISIAKNGKGIQDNASYMDALRKNLKQTALPKNPTVVDDELEKDLKELK